MKRCGKCEGWKPLTEFHTHSGRADGRQSWCKSCTGDYQREYRKTEHGKEVWRRYLRTERGRDVQRKYMTDESHRWQARAHGAVNTAVKAGVLPRITERICVGADCGEQAQHYHHDSYEEADWLKVTPLCCNCHRKRHSKED